MGEVMDGRRTNRDSDKYSGQVCRNCGQPIRSRPFNDGWLGTIWIHDNGDLACTIKGELSEAVFAGP